MIDNVSRMLVTVCPQRPILIQSKQASVGWRNQGQSNRAEQMQNVLYGENGVGRWLTFIQCARTCLNQYEAVTSLAEPQCIPRASEYFFYGNDSFVR